MPNLQGKYCLVTGATSGIGKETAVALATMGATVAIVARSKSKGEAALAEIKRVSGNDRVELYFADLSSMNAIRTLSDELHRRFERLDVLVNNAGAVFTERHDSVDGFELTFATNHLSYFLLTHVLLDLLAKSPSARVVNVSSEAHKSGKIDFGDLQGKQSWSGFTAYGTSKLFNILFTYELARHLTGTKITANCLHPGVIASGFGQNTSGVFRLGIKLIAPFIKNPAEGAATSIYLASAPEVEGVTGKYFKDKKPVSSRKVTYNKDVARELWNISAKLTGIA
jgi:NAD(P)-dependent dehydrogenase (short-subunit alcohol dehydrogenase family)